MKSTSAFRAGSRRAQILFTSVASLLLSVGAVVAENNIWTGAINSDYNNPGNWSLGRVPVIGSGDNMDVRTTPANIATITADVPQVVDIRIGESNTTGTIGTLNHSAGTLSSGPGNWTAIGAGNDGNGSFATGIYNLAGTGTGGTFTGLSQGTGTFNANSRLYVGGTEDNAYGAGGNGTFNVNTTGIVTVTDNLTIGGRGATGTLNFDSGTINVSGEFHIGNNDGSNGTFRMSGGTLNTNNWFGVGRDGANGTMTITGGTINQGLTDQGSRLEMTNFGKPTNATVNLDGGTLHVNGVNNNGGGNTVFNFNGGLLKARIDNNGFMGGLTTALVKSGGARIDTDGHSITIGQSLTGGAGDGGLTKLGNGTLILQGSSSYTGNTVVNAGTLQLANGSQQGTLGGPGAIIVNSGGTLATSNVDALGYYNHSATNSVTINSGGTIVTFTGGRYSMDRTLNVIGGTVATTGTTFDNNASYTFRDFAEGVQNFYNFTSAAAVDGGGAATMSALSVGLSGNTTFNVTKGGGAVDLRITGSLVNNFGNGTLIKAGNGTLVIATADNSYTGTTVFAGGVTNVASFADYGTNSGLGNRAAVDDGVSNVGLLFRGGTLQYTGATPQSTNRAIRVSTDGGGATIDASGSVPEATLSFTATSTPDFFENGGARTLTLTGTNTGNNLFAMPVTETGGATALVKDGTGKWVLTGDNNFTGGTTVNAGHLVLTNNKTGSSNFTVNGTLEFALDNGQRQLSGGFISGTGNLIKSGPSVLMLGGDNAPQVIALTGSSSVIDVRGGVLRNEFLNSAWTGNKASLNVATGAVFDVWDGDTKVDFLSGSGAINKGWSNQNTLTIGVNNGSGTFAGKIYNNRTDFGHGGAAGGLLSLLKDGSGTQILTGENDFAGATTIQGGALELGLGGTIGATSGITVTNGKLRLTGTAPNRVNDLAALVLGTDGMLQLDGPASTSVTETFGQLALSGTVAIIDLGTLLDGGNVGARLTFNGTGQWDGLLQVWNWSGTPGSDGGIDQLDGFAASGLNPAQLASIQFFSGAGGGTAVGSGAQIVNGELVAAAVPEPTGFALLLAGLLPFARRQRNRRGA